MWLFVQEHILGMKWLHELIGKILSSLGIELSSRIGGSLQFFFYDVIKITILLGVLIFSISYLQSYFPPERSRRILTRFNGLTANSIAALLGTVTPFVPALLFHFLWGLPVQGFQLVLLFHF